MANTNTTAEIAEAIGVVEAAEADFEISGVFAEELRRHLLGIVTAYANYYYNEDSVIPVLVRDTLMGDITLSENGDSVTGPYDSEYVCSNNHYLRNNDNEWEEGRHSSVPSKEIEGLLKGLLISFREVVRRKVVGRVMFDTSDNGLSWSMVIFKDDDDWEGTRYDLGPIGAEGLYFHTCKKFV